MSSTAATSRSEWAAIIFGSLTILCGLDFVDRLEIVLYKYFGGLPQITQNEMAYLVIVGSVAIVSGGLSLFFARRP